jgi:YVTN family beta-propeller protein
MDARFQEGPTSATACSKKVSGFLSPGPLGTPALDLNTYYAIMLNQDPTISVVNPRFGYSASELVATLRLKSPGEDWVLSPEQLKLFVSMPDSDEIAVADTTTWNVTTNVAVGATPSRLAIQPDGHYLWAAYKGLDHDPTDSGVAAVSLGTLRTVKRIPTGSGKHEIAFTDDSHYCLVTNEEDDTVSIVDIRKLAKVRDIHTAGGPTSIAWSVLSKMAYVLNQKDGTIAAIIVDSPIPTFLARVEPGVEQIKMAPGGRYGVVVNSQKDLIHVMDVSNNRIVQSLKIPGGPDNVTFSGHLIYVRRKNSEIVSTVPLALMGAEDEALSAAEFPAGQHAMGTRYLSLADSIAQAPGEDAVLVANPADGFVYYYVEGMAAPMGSVSDYGHQPRAVLVLDRSFKERKPGSYESVATLGGPGVFDLALLLDSPKIVHCFPISINPGNSHQARPDLEPKTNHPLKKAPRPKRRYAALTMILLPGAPATS